MENIAIFIGVIAVLCGALWTGIKVFSAFWLAGKGLQLLGRKMQEGTQDHEPSAQARPDGE